MNNSREWYLLYIGACFEMLLYIFLLFVTRAVPLNFGTTRVAKFGYHSNPPSNNYVICILSKLMKCNFCIIPKFWQWILYRLRVSEKNCLNNSNKINANLAFFLKYKLLNNILWTDVIFYWEKKEVRRMKMHLWTILQYFSKIEALSKILTLIKL